MMTSAAVILVIIATGQTSATPSPPPLTGEQTTQVRALVQRTQAAQLEAKEALASAQEQLTRAYAQYELDFAEVSRLQADIVTQQQRLLDNHHRLHVELRKIVGAERFQVLSRRIENVLRAAPSNARPVTSPSPTK